MATEGERRERAAGGRDTSRLEAFSDGVIAIAITLLVLEIAIPAHEEVHSAADLWHHLRELWPSYLGYLISFFTIGIMWANHHTLFRYIARTDHYLVLINLLLLLFIGFIPFPTALLSDYLRQAGQEVAGIVYSGIFLVTALTYNLLWRYASKDHHLLASHVSQRAVDSITSRFRLGPPGYLLAFVLSFFSTGACLAVLAALALLYVLPYSAPEV